MNRTIWKGLILLVLILLTACGSKHMRQVTGLVTELQVGADGGLTGFVVRTDGEEDIGILLTEKTRAFPGEGSWTEEELKSAFQEALQPDTAVLAECARGKKRLTTGSGAKITAYEASYITIIGGLDRGAVTMRDGTPVDVASYNRVGSTRIYRLADGTELLRVNAPHGPDNSYVGGVESFDDLSETAQEKVLAYYEQRGLFYDEQEELEKVYALYQKRGADYRPGLVEQDVVPTASSDRVMYFITTVTLPNGYENGNSAYEIRLGEAFDRQTGDHIDTWDLFTVPQNAAVPVILDTCGVNDQPLRAEIEAASWDGRIVFFPDNLSVAFEPGTLPSQTNSTGFGIGYDDVIKPLLQDWAVPKSW